ncbi:hypothetical protein ACHAXR_003207, partial [Thalassiosira sp. AJA248-18]
MASTALGGGASKFCEAAKRVTIELRASSEAKREVPAGPGSIALNEIDSAVILFLYLEEPSRSLKSYIWNLELLTGTIMHFLIGGGYAGQILFPTINSDRPILRELIAFIDPERIKFGDEKHLKGDEVFNRKVRRNVLTGEVPEMVVSPDFRNRYNLTGFCSI